MKNPSIDEIKEFFSYNPKTGEITATDKHPRLKRMRLGVLRGDGNLAISVKGKTLLGHRLAWGLYYGEWPKGLVKHKNKNKVDNRIDNLFLESPYDNIDAVRYYAGVTYVKVRKRWKAVVHYKGNQRYLGEYEDKEEAILVRLAAEQCLGLRVDHKKSVWKWFEDNLSNREKK